jgi:peptidoglycan/LPS O-acetylase OafA/YrhL
MALLFFVSGYFAAPALDRKGSGRFARDRFVRLGFPTLLYMLLVGPSTQYFLSRTWGGGGFGHQWLVHLEDGQWLSETGPMWFCAALLVFSLAYGLLRQERRNGLARVSLPGNLAVFLFVAVMTLATFAVRVALPENVSILNMHFGDFPQYVLMFGAGVLAYRGRWLEHIPDRLAVQWSVATLAAAAPLFAALIMLGGALHGETVRYNGGFNIVSAGKSLWESLVCVGMSFAAIAFYRRHVDGQGPSARFLSDNAFAVYLFHPPVIVGLALLFRGLEAPALVKAIILTFAAAVATFSLCALVLRRIPVLRRIL